MARFSVAAIAACSPDSAALDRLTYASGLYGALAYGYDAVGNRTSQSGGTTNLTEIYTYAANSNQLQSVVNGTVTRSLGYSPTGNVATDNHGNGTALSFSYDLSDRMVQVANQNTPLASYAYNYLGQRAAKTTSSTITQFVYDRSGHLLAESNGATGAAQTEYVWLDDMPLALVTSGNLYFIHPDHLNTPQKATDGGQTLAWDLVARPFGQTEQQTFPPLSNLRFPGQYFDTESDLAQNWFRDYDSGIGRYIESDPIGLDGGTNTFAYVRGNPTGHIDPTGQLDGSTFIPFAPVIPLAPELLGPLALLGGGGIGLSLLFPLPPGCDAETGCVIPPYDPAPTPGADPTPADTTPDSGPTSPTATAPGRYADSQIEQDYGKYASNEKLCGQTPKNKCTWLAENQGKYRPDQVKKTKKAWGCKGSRVSKGGKSR